MHMYWLVFDVNLKQARIIQEERTSDEKMPLPDRPIGKAVGTFSE